MFLALSTTLSRVAATVVAHRTPVLFLSGEKNRIAAPEGVQRLYEATPTTNKAIVILPGATHRTLNDDTASQYETALVEFLNRYVQMN